MRMNSIELVFEGEVWYWRGPAPWYFVTVPPPQRDVLKGISASVTYGWGMIPVHVQIGRTRWETALWPKDESYVVPIKASVRKAERIAENDTVTISLRVG